MKKLIRRKNSIKIAKKRKKLWTMLGASRGTVKIQRTQDGNYVNISEEKGFVGYFRNNHTLNCGCSMCRNRTFFKRHNNRNNRRLIKQKLYNIKGDYNFEDNCEINDCINLIPKIKRYK